MLRIRYHLGLPDDTAQRETQQGSVIETHEHTGELKDGYVVKQNTPRREV
ncbi:MAG TPA: hypothetical protein VL136_03035 [Candidatus Babeliales bacterium]|jgi:hypothetical protein|nr:hypothetical protein [Candidatus Babeliales bacterium]